jgi:predicted RNA-binding Zn ribbon-like protein
MMTEITPYPSNPHLIGEEPCLIFANTVGGSRHVYEHEYLNDYSDLLAWSQHAGLITSAEAQRLLAEAARRPAEVTIVFERAILLREIIYRIFSAVAAGGSPERADLAILNDALSQTLAKLQVTPDGSGFAWRWRDEPEALDVMLWPVIRSAGELLTSTRVERVRECAGDSCSWLFIDTSKNHRRRWCDMNDCGNRAKARRHYARNRLARKTN